MRHIKNYQRHTKYKHIKESVVIEDFSENQMNFFWHFVEKAKWKSDHNYKRIENFLMDNYERKERELLEAIYQYLLDNLNKKFESVWLSKGGETYTHPDTGEEVEGIPVSDDGWWDLRADVIGRGKEFYNSVTYEKLARMGMDSDYRENFGYSFTN